MQTATAPTALAGLPKRVSECADRVGSLSELARLTGIPRRTMDNYKTGHTEPNASNCEKIARAANVSVQWLVTGEDFDWRLLSEVIETFETVLRAQQIEMDPATKGKLIPLLYKYFESETDTTHRTGFARQLSVSL